MMILETYALATLAARLVEDSQAASTDGETGRAAPMDPGEFQPPLFEESLANLHRSGWTIGDCAVFNTKGEIVWVVSGRNGENLIRTEGTDCGVRPDGASSNRKGACECDPN